MVNQPNHVIEPTQGPEGQEVTIRSIENLVGADEVWFGKEEAEKIGDGVDPSDEETSVRKKTSTEKKRRFWLRVKAPKGKKGDVVDVVVEMPYKKLEVGKFKYL